MKGSDGGRGAGNSYIDCPGRVSLRKSRCKYLKNRKLLPIIVAAIALAAAASVNPAHAAGLLYINPPSQPAAAAGSTVTFQVKVANIDPFSGWDIQVKTDPSAINPSSFTITPNLLVANFSGVGFELIHCVNGVGTLCTLTDGPGIVHSAFQLLSLPPQLGPSSGLLFTITYTAGTGSFSSVHILSETISNGTPTPVAVTVQDGRYGKAPGFSISASPLTVTVGSSNMATVTLTSLNRYSGTVSVTAASNVAGVTALPSPATVTLTSGGSSSYALTVNVASTVTATSALITLTGTGTDMATGLSATNSTSLSVSITPPLAPDLAVTAVTPSPTSLLGGTPVTISVTISNVGVGTASSTTATAFAALGTGTPVAVGTASVPSLAAGASTTVSITWDTTGFVPGSYTVSASVAPVTGETITSNNSLTSTTLVTILAPDCHFVHGKLSWTHHLSLAKSGGVQTFTAHIRCDTAGSEFVQVRVSGVNGIGAMFNAQSIPQSVSPGIVTDITFSSSSVASFVNTKICFTAKVFWGDTATTLTHESPVTKSGCFAVVA